LILKINRFVVNRYLRFVHFAYIIKMSSHSRDKYKETTVGQIEVKLEDRSKTEEISFRSRSISPSPFKELLTVPFETVSGRRGNGGLSRDPSPDHPNLTEQINRQNVVPAERFQSVADRLRTLCAWMEWIYFASYWISFVLLRYLGIVILYHILWRGAFSAVVRAISGCSFWRPKDCYWDITMALYPTADRIQLPNFLIKLSMVVNSVSTTVFFEVPIPVSLTNPFIVIGLLCLTLLVRWPVGYIRKFLEDLNTVHPKFL
jgi:hypothetical protein